MVGYLIHKSYKEVLEFDKENNNTKWADATRDEMDCIKEQEVITTCQRAKWDSNQPPREQGKLNICCEFQWETQDKTCGRWISHSRPHGEHVFRSSIPETIKTCHIPWGTHQLELWGADMGNAYLKAYTHEKLFIIAGAEFEEVEDSMLAFNKALYGLKSSLKKWAERFDDIIKDMGFMPSLADPSVWMRENTNIKCFEYIATYDDDLCIAAHNPGQIIQILKEDYKLKVKRDEPLNHHFGADYTRDKGKTLVC